MSKPSDFVQGTLDVLLLKILALQPLHGWAISQRLTAVSGVVLKVSEGSLYPAFDIVQVGRWVMEELRPTGANRRPRFWSR
jgi:DNA-binding PadR family transcriptional regulator